MLAGQTDDSQALETHLALLAQEKERLDRQIASIEITLTKVREGQPLMAEEMFDGFDHTQYKDEVVEAWGADAYARSDAWWRAKSPEEQRDFQAEHASIATDYRSAQDAGDAPENDRVQSIVARHVAWLNESAAASGGPISPDRLRGYGDMYVADPRFAKHYGGQVGAEFVRAALRRYAQTAL